MVTQTPKDLSFRPRYIRFDLPDPLPRHWHNGDAFKTHFFNAMSVLFPVGERFFIESVWQVRDRVTDRKLEEEVVAFIGQEGNHGREHTEYNRRLRDLGYDIDRLEAPLKKRLAYIKENFSPEKQLAGTVALEHFTAIMADLLLREPQWLEGAPQEMQDMWLWHALEEAEHKAVAFDLFMAICGDRKMLRTAMRQTTILFFFDISRGMWHMLRKDGLFWSLALWWRGLRFLWGRKGFLTRLIPAYRTFYRNDFHPWQHDNRSLIGRFTIREAASQENSASPD